MHVAVLFPDAVLLVDYGFCNRISDFEELMGFTYRSSKWCDSNLLPVLSVIRSFPSKKLSRPGVSFQEIVCKMLSKMQAIDF